MLVILISVCDYILGIFLLGCTVGPQLANFSVFLAILPFYIVTIRLRPFRNVQKQPIFAPAILSHAPL